MAGKIVYRLTEKIRKEFLIDCNPDSFERTYAGKNQKAAGSFVWIMQVKNSPFWIGSVEPASYLIKKNIRLTIDRYGYIYGEEKT